MVNHGRRNNACKLCKERKVKCDETVPSCLRCQKYGRPCPGVALAKPKGLRWRPVLPSQADTPPAPESRTVVALPHPPIGQNQPTLFESHVIHFFFINYVSNNVFMAHLEPTYNTCLRPSALHHIVTALAISRYAHHRQERQQHAIHALRQYQSSLKTLREALQNPHLARQNETLSAILLIIAFETSLCHADSTQAEATCDAHSIGALSLLRSRGPNQFRYPLSLRLFREVRNQIFMNVAFRPTGLQLLYDPDFDWFGDRGYAEPDETRLSTRLVEASWTLPLLRLRTESLLGTSSDGDVGEAESLLHDALAMDVHIGAWHLALPESWTPQTFHPQRSGGEPERFPGWLGAVTAFDSLIAATLHNNYNVLRLLLANAALDAIACLQTERAAAEEEQHWQDQLLGLADGICASVPFQTGRFPDLFAGPDPRDGEQAVRHPLGAHMVFFPLAVVLALDRVPQDRREWVQEQMDYIQEVHGFNLAQDLGGDMAGPA